MINVKSTDEIRIDCVGEGRAVCKAGWQWVEDHDRCQFLEEVQDARRRGDEYAAGLELAIQKILDCWSDLNREMKRTIEGWMEVGGESYTNMASGMETALSQSESTLLEMHRVADINPGDRNTY